MEVCSMPMRRLALLSSLMISTGLLAGGVVHTGAESLGWRTQVRAGPRASESEQRILHRECVSKASAARKRAQAFSKTAMRVYFEPNKVRQPLSELSSAIEETLRVHDRFLKTLSERQWHRSEGDIAKLETLKAAVHAKLDGIDLELRMPKPDSKILVRYARRIDRDLNDWEKLYRKIGYSEGSGDGDRSAAGTRPNFSIR